MPKHEPHKIKSVRPVHFFSLEERKKFLEEVEFNTGLLPDSQITFDMTTQGTSAMSQDQVGALFLGDEAYAGARNFYHLTEAVSDIFGMKHVCPVHNKYGGLKLLCSIFLSKDKAAAGNTLFPKKTVEYFGRNYHYLELENNKSYPGNIDLNMATEFLEKNKGKIPFLYIDITGDGYRPLSLQNLSELKTIAESFHSKIICDISCIVEWAYFIKKNDNVYHTKPLSSIISSIKDICSTFVFDAGQDAMSNVGGFLATNDPEDHEHHQNEVVVYEGLHTYGGMAGRTMEVVSIGLREMVRDSNAEWTAYQIDRFSESLEQKEVPFVKGMNGVHLFPHTFMDDPEGHAAHAFSAGLYLTSGVRTHLHGSYEKNSALPILIPRRSFMNSQLEQIAEAVSLVFKQKENMSSISLKNTPEFQHEAKWDWSIPELNEYNFSCEPYTVHSIENVGIKTGKEREEAMMEAGYNTFLLKSEDVTIDFLTDSGTSAMSIAQWMSYLSARETPALSDAYQEVVDTSQKIYGHKYVILTHQGRAAEHIMSQMFIQPGDYVPGNMYFTTTKLHQEMAGGIFVDVIVDEAHQTTSEFRWKGNIDLNKLEDAVSKASGENKRIAYISYEFNVNMAGGQPVSMDNIKDVYAFCRPLDIPVFFDATRCAENACFIQRKDPHYAEVPVADILLEMFRYGDGATISSKKDMLSNLSGSLMFRDNPEWYKKGLAFLQLFEGPHSSGGTSAGDMAAHAQGLREMVEDTYINSRIDQTEYLGELLIQSGIPIVMPPGGHAIFLDARRFLPHVDQDQFPAQMLAAQIFIETGVRAMERGNVSKGRDPQTGENYRPHLELVRLTIPRRVYTRDHMKAVAEGIKQLYKKRDSIQGLKLTYEPEKLRFFQGRFKKVTG